jgi:hypothetical protein
VVRLVLSSDLNIPEIMTDDHNVIFFESSKRGLAKLRQYEEGVDVIHVTIICQNINFSSEEIEQMEKLRSQAIESLQIIDHSVSLGLLA